MLHRYRPLQKVNRCVKTLPQESILTRDRMFKTKPVHDWSSHAADAMRYLAVGLQEINTRQTAPQVVADNSYRII